MKKLINLVLLMVLVSVFISFSYAWEASNGGEDYSDDGFIDERGGSDEGDEGNITQGNDSTISNGGDLTTFEKAFQEVAYAYYMRWPYIHYNVAKGKSDILPSPEESTSQNYNYMACGLFVMNVFKELLGIDLSYSDAPYSTYGQKIGTRKEVIWYGVLQTGGVDSGSLYWYDGSKNESGELNVIKDPSQSYVISQLKIGDILHQDGHAMLVYDLIYDDTGNVINAYLIHSFQQGVYYPIAKRATSSSNVIYDKTGNKVKLSIGHGPWSMLFYNIYQRSGGRLEGTIALETFKNRAKNGMNLLFDPSNKNNKYLDDYEIIRFVTTNDEWEDILNLYGLSSFKTKTINDQVVEYSDSVKSRLKYSKLYIEKTVDKRDNNIVDPGDELKYKIVIKNESNWNYEDDLIVKENIDTNLVEYLNYSYTKSWTSTDDVYLSNNVNQLQWNIGKLNSKDEVTIEYTVKIKTGHMGKIIESTGLVDNIPSGIVKNKIGRNINKWEELKQSYNNLSGSYTGKVLINKIYEETYGVNLRLDNLKILTNMSGDQSGLIYFNNGWGSWSSWDDDTYMAINKKNIFSWIVLNSYFNALYKKPKVIISYNDIIVQPYVIPAIWLRKNDPDNRANTIFSTDFKTWDVLIYINKNDIRYSLSGYDTLEKYLTYENGEYAYIYIDGDFVGINLGNDGLSGTQDDRNEFNIDYYEDNGLTEYKKRGTNITVTGESKDQLEEFLHYQTLFGKDAYVILRPSLAIRNISYELDGWTNNNENPNAFMLGSDIGLKEPTKSSYVFKWWYTDPEYANQVNNTSEFTDDVILYAKWENSQSNNYSNGGWRSGGWWGHRWLSNSNTNNHINENQHWLADESQIADENQQKIKESDKIIKIHDEKNEITANWTVISNNPYYTKEFNAAYSFAKTYWITNKPTIQDAKMYTELTRIQMAKMLSQYAINVLGQTPDYSRWVVSFNDVSNKLNKEYDNAVTLAYQLWIMWINMKNNNFRPRDTVTRAEFVTALSRMLYWVEDGKWNTKYYEPHMFKLYNEWIINNTNAKMNEKRWYVMIILMRTVK